MFSFPNELEYVDIKLKQLTTFNLKEANSEEFNGVNMQIKDIFDDWANSSLFENKEDAKPLSYCTTEREAAHNALTQLLINGS